MIVSGAERERNIDAQRSNICDARSPLRFCSSDLRLAPLRFTLRSHALGTVQYVIQTPLGGVDPPDFR